MQERARARRVGDAVGRDKDGGVLVRTVHVPERREDRVEGVLVVGRAPLVGWQPLRVLRLPPRGAGDAVEGAMGSRKA
jgi:hypothetical protein